MNPRPESPNPQEDTPLPAVELWYAVSILVMVMCMIRTTDVPLTHEPIIDGTSAEPHYSEHTAEDDNLDMEASILLGFDSEIGSRRRSHASGHA
jgi:hypothetical protein